MGVMKMQIEESDLQIVDKTKKGTYSEELEKYF